MSVLTDPPAAPGSLDAGLEAASERLNPILIKEVRQALRGPNFRRAYLCVIAIAGAFGVWQLLSGYNSGSWSNLGERLFIAQYWALAIGLCALLPIQAYQTLGTEREEHTLELLLLSGLSPGQIVNGKLISVLAQGLVVLSAFLPLIALAYLLRGIDLFAILALVPICILGSAIACSIAAFLSANIEKRMPRVLGIGVVAFGGVGLTFGMAGLAREAASEIGEIGRDPNALFAFLNTVVAAGCVTALFLAGARAGFAHAEEDGLRSLRRVTAVSALIACAFALVALAWPGLQGRVLLGTLIGAAILLAPSFLFLMTDRERMGRHAAEGLRRGRRGWLPMLPGGGLGVLLYVCIALAFGAVLFAAVNLKSGIRSDDSSLVLTPLSYTLFYIGVPSGLLAKYTGTPAGRLRVRVAVAIFTGGCILLPMVLGGFVGDRDLAQGEHYLNFFWAMSRQNDALVEALALGFVGLLVNVVRMLAGRAKVVELRSAGRLGPSAQDSEPEPQQT